jgi:hypothetical protein
MDQGQLIAFLMSPCPIPIQGFRLNYLPNNVVPISHSLVLMILTDILDTLFSWTLWRMTLMKHEFSTCSLLLTILIDILDTPV